MEPSFLMELSLMRSTGRFAVFTDLDGTLLDHDTYSFSPAREALNLLAAHEVPLVLCSSKTRAEIEVLQQDLGLRHPFISENGGALFIARGYFPFELEETCHRAAYEVFEFGTPYHLLVETLHRVAARVGVGVVGFSDMSIEEVARECNLTLAQARLAKLREYDEPFRIVDPDPALRSRLISGLRRAGLYRCAHAGRYDHLTGLSDKGRAVRTLKSLYERAWGKLFAVGLGDSLNDLSLLREMDLPVIVQNASLGAASRLLEKVPTARVTQAAGPRGWNEAVLEILGNCTAMAG